MATAEMPFQPERMNWRSDLVKRCPQVVGILQAERAEEIFPLLLEGILALGCPRALVASVNFETGEIAPSAVLRWPPLQIGNFTTTLGNSEHPLVSVLRANRPAVLTRSSLHNRPVYLHPILYSNQNPCREAEGAGAVDCLAIQNFRREKQVRAGEQICSVCGIRGFAGVVVAEVPRNTSQNVPSPLIELASQSLYRLFKAE